MKVKSNKFIYNLKDDMPNIRNEIDQIDLAILELLNRRLRLVRKIGKLKRKSGKLIIDDFREAQIINHLIRLNDGPIDSNGLRKIFSDIIKVSRALQIKDVVVCFGSMVFFCLLV